MIQDFAVTRGGARVVFGTRASRALPLALKEARARRVLLVTTPGRAELAEALSDALRDLSLGVLATAAPQVPIEVAQAARAEARRLNAEWIVAVGGGSAIGLAKAIALDQQVGLGAVPTTYAGSEMTAIYGITEGDRKITGSDPRVCPQLVIYDPAHTHELPYATSVTSAFNAMAHAVETLYADAIDPLTLGAAEDAIARLASALPALHAARDGAPEDAQDTRRELLYGAHLAATCLASAKMGLHHKLCHVLGGSFGLPHAATHTVILPHVIHFNRQAASAAVARIARACGHLGAAAAAPALFDLMSRVEAPLALRSLGLAESDLDRVVAIALENPYPNPRTADRDHLRALLDDAYHGRRPGSQHDPAATPTATRAQVTSAAGPSVTPVAHTVDSDPDGVHRSDQRANGALQYLSGFGAALQSEALPGALPRTQNSPKPAPYGLYSESINGTPFTQRRAENLRAWLYRIRPSVGQSRMEPVAQDRIVGRFDGCSVVPDLVRWKPLAMPPADRRTDFSDGLYTLCGAGDPDLRSGLAIHLYAANADMKDRCFCNADGDLLIVPDSGPLRIRTEFGWLAVRPGEFALIQRGMKFTVELPDGAGRGFVLEIFGAHFRLPDRGPIGANGLADERHFLAPVAAYEDRACPGYEVLVKHGGALFRSHIDHSPYDVVAWHGNYAPYKYDLAMFNSFGSVSFDHPDPSILTVLSSPLDDHGTNLADFAVFRGRWDVAEHTFRPPYYHRNIATEFNAIIHIDEPYLGYEQGSCFLTPSMTPHGIGGAGYLRAIDGQDTPKRLSDESVWIMFESALGVRLTPWASAGDTASANSPSPSVIDESYHDMWRDMPVTFQPPTDEDA